MKTLRGQLAHLGLHWIAMSVILVSVFIFSGSSAKADNSPIEKMPNSTWTESENGWSGKWTPSSQKIVQNGSTYSRKYHADWSREKPANDPNAPTEWHAKLFVISISGNKVTIARKDPDEINGVRGGAEVQYTGTIIDNAVKDGTTNGFGGWTAIIECQ